MAYIRYGELEETTCEYCGCSVTPDDEPVDLPIGERTGYACQDCYKEVIDVERLENEVAR